MAREMLNIRVEAWLDELIEQATEASGAASKSEWAREALEAGARREIAAKHPVGPVPATGLGGGFLRRRQVCAHPVTAKKDTVRAEVCGLCGAVTRVKL